ncbi:hypothetical protein JW916_01110 [Candidatus Sumerlaeota bacterium]|nr:hypothetical protein [Candidatus Sumerlaeota bacterium]
MIVLLVVALAMPALGNTTLYLRDTPGVLNTTPPTGDTAYGVGLAYGSTCDLSYTLSGDIDGGYYSYFIWTYAYPPRSYDVQIIHRTSGGAETVLAEWLNKTTPTNGYWYPATGSLSTGVNPSAQAGDFIILRLRGNGSTASEFRWGSTGFVSTISIPSPGVAPVVNDIADDSAHEGSSYTGPLPSLSAGTQPISWQLVDGPPSMTIDPSSGQVSWPSPTTVDSPHLITIRATNGTGSDDEDWLLTVNPAVGSLHVTIGPQEAVDAGAQWRRVGTAGWFDSDETENGIPSGSHTVEFKSVSGWNAPANVPVTINSGETTTLSGSAATYTPPPGSLQVVLGPPEAIAGGAMWRLAETGSPWRDSGYTETDLSPTTYTVRFKEALTPAPGWCIPPNRNIVVNPAQATQIDQTYVGRVRVTIDPPAAVSDGAQWRVMGVGPWRDSGESESGFDVGTTCTIRFKDLATPAPGWTTPARQTVTNDQPTDLAATYQGRISMTLLPAGAVSAGAQWCVLGVGPWRNSGENESGLDVGTTYAIQFRDAGDWVTPAQQDVPVDGPTTGTATYGAPPTFVDANVWMLY